MHKAVFEAPEEMAIKLLAQIVLQKISHMLWLEQPEKVITCIALRPHTKEEVSQYLKKFQLFK